VTFDQSHGASLLDPARGHSEPRKRRPQARALATRARILASAEELFTQQGEDATAMQDVAQRAGISVGTLYHHFADKRTLLLELIDAWGDARMARRRSELDFEAFLGNDPRGAVRCWLRRVYERLSTRPTLYLVILSLAERDPEVRQRYRRIEEVAIERLRTLIEFGRARGLMRRDVDPAAAAFLIQHAIDMTVTQLLVHEFRGPDPELVLGELGEMICRYVLEEFA